MWITFELNNRLRSIFAFENDQKSLKCLVHNEYGFRPFSIRSWSLRLRSISATWGYVSALLDKILKQRPRFLGCNCLCKDTVPTRYWLKLLCLPQQLKYFFLCSSHLWFSYIYSHLFITSRVYIETNIMISPQLALSSVGSAEVKGLSPVQAWFFSGRSSTTV